MKLFVRTPTGLSLTVEGAKLAPALRVALEQMDTALQGLQTNGRGRLVITATETFAVTILAQHLGEFRRQHPGLTVHLDSSARIVDLAAEPFDVAIRTGRGNWPGMYARRLLDSRLTPMLSPTLLKGAPVPRSPSDLLNWPLLAGDGSPWDRWFEAAGATLPSAPETVMIAMSAQIVIAEAVSNGLGVALLNPGLFRAQLASGRLIQPFTTTVGASFGYYLTYLDSRREDPVIAAFERWVVDAVAASS